MKKLKILVIEDDSLFAAKINHFLTSNHFDVTVVNDVARGAHYVTSLKPDCIILDNKLPRTDGVEVIDFYRELSPNSKIILMSGNFNIEEIAIAIQKKVNYIFEKGELTQDLLIKVIDELLISENISINSMVNKLKKIFTSSNTTVNKKSVVLLDDDELFIAKLKNIILQKYNLEVFSFSNEDDFYKNILEIKPKLIFLDFLLPNSNALEIVKTLKKINLPSKIILISAQNNPEVAIQLNALGIEGYLVKNENWENKIIENYSELLKC
jgi:two-component system chemotaxis response regulator CheY